MGFEIKELIIGQGFVAKSYDNCSLVLLGFLKICFTIFFFFNSVWPSRRFWSWLWSLLQVSQCMLTKDRERIKLNNKGQQLRGSAKQTGGG